MEGKSGHPVLACTRPAMFIGIPLQAFAVLLICCGEFFVLSGLSGAGVPAGGDRIAQRCRLRGLSHRRCERPQHVRHPVSVGHD